MSKKGETKKTKALNVSKAVHIRRKENVWTVRTKAGPHKKDLSVALGIILRNFTQLARTMKEVKAILNAGEVKINGVVRKSHQFSVGLFDIVSIEKQELNYRVMLDKAGRIILKELKNPSNEKLCKVTHKKATSKGIQLTTNDGRTFIGAKANVGDTLKIKVPENKIEEVLSLEKGSLVYIFKGSHCAEKGKVLDIVPGTIKREKLVKIQGEEKEYETTECNIFIIGKNSEAIADIK
jgi:small subunit ribosomal protein S4e